MRLPLVCGVILLCVTCGIDCAQTIEHPLRIKGEVVPPTIDHQVDPHFSRKMRKAAANREVLVHIVVDEQGHVSTISVKEPGDPEFDQSALDAVARWKFKPATLHNVPVAVELNVAVNFQVVSK